MTLDYIWKLAVSKFAVRAIRDISRTLFLNPVAFSIHIDSSLLNVALFNLFQLANIIPYMYHIATLRLL